MVDVTHDGHDRWAGSEVDRLIRRHCLLRHIREEILLLANGLEAELCRDQVDLIKVESLVDRDHEAEILERERDDLRGRDLEDLRELADGDELVYANGLPLALGRLGAQRLLLLALNAASQIGRGTTLRTAAQRSDRLRDVRIDCLAIDC